MQVCIYTTNHQDFLQYMLHHCTPADLVCFRSNRKWVSARRYLRSGTLPMLIREIDNDADEFVCNFVAELVEVWFPGQFETDGERRAWLQDKLWLQREVYKEHDPKPGFETSEGQFQAWELDYFTNLGETYYIIRNLRRIKPLPLPQLMKVKVRKVGDSPQLSPKYIRSYSLCWYPESKVHVLDAGSGG
jgi:hypothetical protein